jgi:hypothetical protein
MKAVLVPTKEYDAAIDQFAAAHLGLFTQVAPEYHGKLFVDRL